MREAYHSRLQRSVLLLAALANCAFSPGVQQPPNRNLRNCCYHWGTPRRSCWWR